MVSQTYHAYFLVSSDFWKVSIAAPVFKKCGERSDTRNCHPVSFSNIFLITGRLVGCNEKVLSFF